MIPEIIQFENLIKDQKCLFFDKIYERTKDGYKLIYNIQGLMYDNKIYTNLKIIFWLNKQKTKLIENVITYLSNQCCDYKSITLDQDIMSNVKTAFNTIMSYIDDEITNKDLNQFVETGTSNFNKQLHNLDIKDFVLDLKFIAHGNVSCILTKFKFELHTNDQVYTFELKCIDKQWEFIYKDKTIQVDFDNIYKKIIETIYEIN